MVRLLIHQNRGHINVRKISDKTRRYLKILNSFDEYFHTQLSTVLNVPYSRVSSFFKFVPLCAFIRGIVTFCYKFYSRRFLMYNELCE